MVNCRLLRELLMVLKPADEDEASALAVVSILLVNRRLLKELLEDGKRVEEADDDEVTWETVQEVFDRVQDRSWQLLADDLTVCIRPDGTDWILGAGGFGRVGSVPCVLRKNKRKIKSNQIK